MKKFALYIFIAVIFMTTGCQRYLETIEPSGKKVSNEQIAELAKKNPQLVFDPMVAGIVRFMHNGSVETRNVTDKRGLKNWNLSLDLIGNDMVLGNLTNWFKEDYSMLDYRITTSMRAAQHWANYYKIIYLSNEMLGFMPENAEGDILVYKAQALTLRAMAYYYLLNIYQLDYNNGGSTAAGVPYYTSTSDPDKPRGEAKQVYEDIIADLKEAVDLLEKAGYDHTESLTDIDQSVANMILAKACVTYGDFDLAASAAAKVIAQYQLADEAGYVSTTTVNGFFHSLNMPETIWGYQWASASSLGNAAFASHSSVIGNGYGGSTNKSFLIIDNRLYDQIPSTDYRKKNFVDVAFTWAPATGDSYTVPKYANLKFATPTYQVDEIYMRVSEAYLIKAEAEARGNKASDAQQTLFNLVSKRDSGYSKSTKTGDALLEEIYFQARVELWGEGHEFFLNKRFNKGVNRTTSTSHIITGINYPPGKDFVFHLPQDEMTYNTALTPADQNE